MEYYRSTEDCFKNLKDYPFEPHYLQVNEVRMHYIDKGPKEGAPILILYGEPSWSYLYRHMIPICAVAGHRVIAPDLIGFGKSDKPKNIRDYSYQAHMELAVDGLNNDGACLLKSPKWIVDVGYPRRSQVQK